ncbi:hypothetical protein D9757_009867 [Collybiopsis confluens]|uniref:Uncharacterized protein n=1 Tax=Collybiopsis confluens TaxID=2823264 RepID=A0A8H5H799_9AGAR|nr:hypothetical protein D9757_009867 [Collybiopsis confluens]
MNDDVDMFFPPDRHISLHGRDTFTRSVIDLATRLPPENANVSTSSVSSLTPEQRQLRRRGFSEAKNRLYKLLQDIGAPFEVITGAPILQGQQEAAHMVPSSADNPTLLHLEYAFGF